MLLRIHERLHQHRRAAAPAGRGCTPLGLPPQVLANGLAELVAAQPRQRRGHLRHVRNLASGQPLAAERGELEALDAGVDGDGRTHPKPSSQNRAKMSSILANKIVTSPQHQCYQYFIGLRT